MEKRGYFQFVRSECLEMIFDLSLKGGVQLERDRDIKIYQQRKLYEQRYENRKQWRTTGDKGELGY